MGPGSDGGVRGRGPDTGAGGPGQNGRVADPAVQSAEARRQAVASLRLAQAVAGYAADQVADGLGPEEARAAVLDASEELARLAVLLWRLASPWPVDGEALAVELAASGVPRWEIAMRLGVSARTVRGYLLPGTAGETG